MLTTASEILVMISMGVAVGGAWVEEGLETTPEVNEELVFETIVIIVVFETVVIIVVLIEGVALIVMVTTGANGLTEIKL